MRALITWLRRVLGMSSPGPAALPVRMDSPEEYWLDRARAATARCRVAAGQARRGAVSERCSAIAGQAAASLLAMERVAGQASLLHRTLAGMNVSGLRAEESRLRAALGSRPEEPGGGLQRALASVQEQERVAARLEQTQAGLLARLEASAMELEGLHAGLAEVVALAETGAIDGEQRLESLGREVEGLRLGLIEAVDTGRLAIDRPSRALGPSPQPFTTEAEPDGAKATLAAADVTSPIVPVKDRP